MGKLDEFVSACQQTTGSSKKNKVGDGWNVMCPVHGGSGINLSVAWTGEKLLIHCKAHECSIESITSAIGWELKDLFEGSIGESPASLGLWASRLRVSEEFLTKLGWSDVTDGVVVPYYQEDGSHFRDKVRISLDGKQKYKWGPGTGQSLFGLQFLSAIKQRGYVYLVEGETDSVVLWHNRHPAMGVPGAQAVKVIEAHHLEGIEKVYVIQESDNAGVAFTNGVASRMVDLGLKAPKIVKVVGAKDLCELWQRRGAAFNPTLKAAVSRASEWVSQSLDFTWAEDISTEETLWIDKRHPIGEITMYSARTSFGKTSVVLDTISRWARGESVPGQDPPRRPLRSLYVAAEDSVSKTIVGRLITAGSLKHIAVFDALNNPIRLDLEDDISKLDGAMERGRFDVVVLDPLAGLVGEIRLNKAEDIRKMLNPVIRLARKHQAAVIVIHHAKKGQVDDPLDSPAGSVQLAAVSRSMISFARKTKVLGELDDMDPSSPMLMLHVKSNLGARTKTLQYRIDESGRVAWGEESDIAPEDLTADPANPSGNGEVISMGSGAALQFVKDVGRSKVWQVRQHLIEMGYERSTAYAAINQAVERSTLTREKGDGRDVWLSLPMPF